MHDLINAKKIGECFFLKLVQIKEIFEVLIFA